MEKAWICVGYNNVVRITLLPILDSQIHEVIESTIPDPHFLWYFLGINELLDNKNLCVKRKDIKK
jgi:hypothetical protein